VLRINDDGAGNTTDVLSFNGEFTQGSLTSGLPQLPFFVDGGRGNIPYSGSFNNGLPQLTGFAQRMVINPSLVADPSRLVVMSTSPMTPQGDTTRPQFLVDALTKSVRTISTAAGIGGTAGSFTSTVANYVRQVVDFQGASAEQAGRLNEGQSVALATVEARFAETSGVNIDQEMAILVQLQTAYGANARVMTAARDMMDMLFRL
jgi:flagellar hook-associated protein 1 FlgK